MTQALSDTFTSWEPIEEGELRTRIVQVLRELVQHYKEPEQVRERMRKVPAQQLDGYSYDRWIDVSLASGFPGICLLMGELDRLFPGEGWDKVGHKCLQLLQKTIEKEGIVHLSLFNGLAGILAGTYSLSRGGTRYQGMTDVLANYYEQAMRSRLVHIREAWQTGHISMGDYDVIQGLSGMGRIAMLHKERPMMEQLWEETSQLLHLLCVGKEVNGFLVPSWHISSKYQFSVEDRINYPNGNFNLGLSHGIAGPLAFLSISYLNGMRTATIEKDIETLAEFICKWSIEYDHGIIFAGKVSFEEWKKDKLSTEINKGYRDSWCYGVPGIARALWLAGRALKRDKWIRLGMKAYADIEKRADRKGGFTSGTICHGVGGVLHLVQRMYTETKNDGLKRLRDQFAREMLDFYEPESVFGYYDESYLDDGACKKVDESGFLTGAAGVALILASLLNKQSPEWDIVLMIQ
ncbi:MAG TPA: lanthionine synthetase C family protein [Bacillus sp. (in: firmicutes)]|nr:lanthionine synthetase C family protein [Bacillus sp. (in: firmicutes)]